MKLNTAFLQITHSKAGGRKVGLVGFAGAALLLGLAVATAYSKSLPTAAPVQELAWVAAAAQDSTPDAPMPVDLYRFALNALLVPLMDDSVPPRWTDLAIGYTCDQGTTVTIDGEPLIAGKPVPAKPFTVRWVMNRCAPMGPQSIELTGHVELLVFHQGGGLSAMVSPDGLQVDSYLGRAWLQGPFAAETSLAVAVARQ